MESPENQSTVNVAQLVEQCILSRKISRRQYHQLSVVILADGQIDEEERHQINRLFDAIQSGQLKILD